MLSVEAGLLLAFMLVGRIVLDGQSAAGGSWDYYLLAVLAVLAMGWQTAALRRVAGVPVHTTFVTGILTHLCRGERERLVRMARLAAGGDRRCPDDVVAVAFRRARLHGGVWSSYLAGGVIGAFIALHWDLWSLTLPLTVLAALVAIDLARSDARA